MGKKVRVLVTYECLPMPTVDDSIIEAFKKLGFDFIGSGFSFGETGVRDLEFKILEEGGTDDGRKK